MITVDAKVLMFDMDGTMVDNKVFHDKAWIKFCEHHAPQSFDSVEFMKTFYGKTNKQLMQQVFGRPMGKGEIEMYEEIKESCYRDMYRPYIKLVDGLEQLLHDAARKKKICVITTSAPKSNVDFVLKETGITHYFTHIVDASMVTDGKPSPQVYLKALEITRASTHECIAFEDSRAGIASSLAAGIKTIGVNTDLSSEQMKSLGVYCSISSYSTILL